MKGRGRKGEGGEGLIMGEGTGKRWRGRKDVWGRGREKEGGEGSI